MFTGSMILFRSLLYKLCCCCFAPLTTSWCVFLPSTILAWFYPKRSCRFLRRPACRSAIGLRTYVRQACIRRKLTVKDLACQSVWSQSEWPRNKEVCLPVEGAHALLLVVNVFSVVFPTIGPFEDALPFHLIILPLTFVLAPVTPVVYALWKNKVVRITDVQKPYY